ncbi:MAG: lysylphosphatidylglycerol synthase domain-containing protein [Fimbriiglobus sp.]
MFRNRKRMWLAVKTLAAGGLVAAVGWRFAGLLTQDGMIERLATARVGYLLPAGLLYLMAHLIWGAFWVRLLRNQGGHVGWAAGLRAYFVSQFGKYVPGKAWVLLLRVALLHHTGLSPTVIAVTAALETLTSMAAGALIAAALLPWAGLGVDRGSWTGAALAAVAGMPVVLVMLVKLADRVVRKHRSPDAVPLPNPPVSLLFQGLVQDAVGWLCLGLSLWLTVQAILPETGPLTPDHYLQDLAAATSSYVFGFLVFISPGGLGAREGLLQRILAVQFAPTAGESAAGLAAGAAVMLRLVWTAFEVVFALTLLWAARPRAATGGPIPHG